MLQPGDCFTKSMAFLQKYKTLRQNQNVEFLDNREMITHIAGKRNLHSSGHTRENLLQEYKAKGQEMETETEKGEEVGLKANVEKHIKLARCQEALYNTGRAFQQINLLHLAIPQYEAVLHIYDTVKKDEKKFLPYYSSLTRETAHNLVVIYRKKQGNHHTSNRERILGLMENYLSL